MPISAGRTILIIAICTAITFGERLLPFLVFRKGEAPEIIRFLARVLPVAIMTTLVIYCMRDISFATAATSVPALIGVAVTAVLHWWKGNTLLSVIAGTACYMVLVQFVF